MIPLLFLATCFLAYSNGANDNFKGVASLFGSRTTSYRTAILWATFTTASGSIAAIFLAHSLLARFSGKGLVPDAFTTQPEFLLAVAIAAGATVILATLFGLPISTTHALTGALVGAGAVTGLNNLNFAALGKNFFSPLFLTPIVAIAASAILYTIFRGVRSSLGINEETCICVSAETGIVANSRSDGALAAEARQNISITTGQTDICQRPSSETVLGLRAGTCLDRFHFLSAGAVSFARGLNDTPKIAALLLVATAIDIQWSLVAVAITMAIGGLLNARKVADTMSNKITGMNAGQGFAANLATAMLVIAASYYGSPVSTTHVSVGSLLGIGIVTRQVRLNPVFGVILSWIVTVPCAAAVAALAYAILRPI